MRIANNVERLEVGMKRNDETVTINLVLTWDESHLVLIDTGFPGMTDTIVKAIAEAGFSAENITEIILTHQDIDHIGCCLDLMKLAPFARVLAHEAEAPYIEGRETPVKLAGLQANIDHLTDQQREFYEMLKAGFATRQIPIAQTLKDHEVLPFCGGIEAVFTPGHTPGHMSLYLQESHIMVCGDAANIKDGELVGPNPPMTYDMGLAMQSLVRIKSYDMYGAVAYHTGYLSMK